MSEYSQKIIYLCQNPDKVDLLDIDFLEKISEEYPFFQATKILIAKAHATKENIQLAAAYSVDRRNLSKILSKSKEEERKKKNIAKEENMEKKKNIEESVEKSTLFNNSREETQKQNIPYIPIKEKTASNEFKKYEEDFFSTKSQSVKIFTSPESIKKKNKQKADTIKLKINSSWFGIKKLQKKKKTLSDREKRLNISWFLKSKQASSPTDEPQNKEIEGFMSYIKKIPKDAQTNSDSETTDLIPQDTTWDIAIATESLAELMFQQKKYEDAIQIYQLLQLKKKEKYAFFAEKIKDIETIIKNKI